MDQQAIRSRTTRSCMVLEDGRSRFGCFAGEGRQLEQLVDATRAAPRPLSAAARSSPLRSTTTTTTYLSEPRSHLVFGQGSAHEKWLGL